MSSSVLYDAPGPKARMRNRIYSVIGTAAIIGLAVVVVMRLADRGHFESEVWNTFNYSNVRETIRDGVLTTLKVFALAGVLSLVLGVLLAVARASDHRPVRWLATGFIELFRAIPLLITIYALWVLFLTYKGDLGAIGENNGFWALVLGLAVYNGAVQAEVLRAGFNAVPRGQVEAAYALGLRKSQVMTMLLLPQAVRSMLPTIISQLVVTLKDTSLGYIITYSELLYAGRQLANTTLVNGQYIYVPVIMVVGTIYVAMCLALSALATWIEKRGRRTKTGIAVAAAAEPAEAPGVLDPAAVPAPAAAAGETGDAPLAAPAREAEGPKAAEGPKGPEGDTGEPRGDSDGPVGKSN
ncbi:amino acid ABC transporter permease [Streptomyces alfalfae]|uniref:amino acid ABC transporter permease n=1 Tax=Streptomyces alfalfae TaxID=1642299 RepID=UPI001BA9D3DE|nr:amino acid ABC transporter permease [Streptomyces alfalfae]QUI34247.1 amino acid ABC transporter permease [Streptomyces alfalfae]